MTASKLQVETWVDEHRSFLRWSSGTIGAVMAGCFAPAVGLLFLPVFAAGLSLLIYTLLVCIYHWTAEPWIGLDGPAQAAPQDNASGTVVHFRPPE